MTAEDMYRKFRDPAKDFAKEPRAFCYDLASRLIKEAKEEASAEWYSHTKTVQGILLLLFAWNFAAKITKQLDLGKVERVLKAATPDLRALEGRSIVDANEEVWEHVALAFKLFLPVFGQTGAAKALSLLNTGLFVMWDTGIRQRLRKTIKGIGNGETEEKYVLFLKGMQRIIKEYKLDQKVPPEQIAKKIDEYHYVKIIMAKKPAQSSAC